LTGASSGITSSEGSRLSSTCSTGTSLFTVQGADPDFIFYFTPTLSGVKAGMAVLAAKGILLALFSLQGQKII